jgi:hypothetical protein
MSNHFTVDLNFFLSSSVLYPAKDMDQTYYGLTRIDLGMQLKTGETLR